MSMTLDQGSRPGGPNALPLVGYGLFSHFEDLIPDGADHVRVVCQNEHAVEVSPYLARAVVPAEVTLDIERNLVGFRVAAVLTADQSSPLIEPGTGDEVSEIVSEVDSDFYERSRKTFRRTTPDERGEVFCRISAPNGEDVDALRKVSIVVGALGVVLEHDEEVLRVEAVVSR